MKGRRTGPLFRKSIELENREQPQDGQPPAGDRLTCESIEFQEFHAMRVLIGYDLYPQVSGILLGGWREKYPTEAAWQRFLWKELGISLDSAALLIQCGERWRAAPLLERVRWMRSAKGFLTEAVARKAYRLVRLWGGRPKAA